MRTLLLDTHLLLWAAGAPDRLSPRAVELLQDPTRTLVFSAVSLWEIGVKAGLGRADFVVNGVQLRRGLLAHGYLELAMTGEHALELRHLPPVHRDPFDRMLVCQARSEGITLLTADAAMEAYGVPVMVI